ncbi:hypothetical protein, partial [Pseudomonas chlororaphis]|uniref:hypothetical protein n=1 Tax=Pseudomonas chlororaphis TaxID=587753 RepID=UPI001B336550
SYISIEYSYSHGFIPALKISACIVLRPFRHNTAIDPAATTQSQPLLNMNGLWLFTSDFSC